MIEIICWALIVMAVVNLYFVWHGWLLNLSVDPRSPVLRALFWVKFSLWLMSVYFAVVSARFLAGVEPVLPFGGIGLALIVLYVLTVPAVIHSQMRHFISADVDRDQVRDDARDEGRDSVRDPARDLARDVEHDATNGP